MTVSVLNADTVFLNDRVATARQLAKLHNTSEWKAKRVIKQYRIPALVSGEPETSHFRFYDKDIFSKAITEYDEGAGFRSKNVMASIMHLIFNGKFAILNFNLKREELEYVAVAVPKEYLTNNQDLQNLTLQIKLFLQTKRGFKVSDNFRIMTQDDLPPPPKAQPSFQFSHDR